MQPETNARRTEGAARPTLRPRARLRPLGKARDVRRQAPVELGGQPGVLTNLGEIVGADSQEARGLIRDRRFALPGHPDE